MKDSQISTFPLPWHESVFPKVMQSAALDITGSGPWLDMSGNPIFAPLVLGNSLLSAASPLCLLQRDPGAQQMRCAFEKQLWRSLHSTPRLPRRKTRAEKTGCSADAWCGRRTTCARMPLLTPESPNLGRTPQKVLWGSQMRLTAHPEAERVVGAEPGSGAAQRPQRPGTYSLSHPLRC